MMELSNLRALAKEGGPGHMQLPGDFVRREFCGRSPKKAYLSPLFIVMAPQETAKASRQL